LSSASDPETRGPAAGDGGAGGDHGAISRATVLALSAAGHEPDWLRARRLEAWEIQSALPLPGLSDEAWRRTDIRSLALERYRVLSPDGERAPGQAGEPAEALAARVPSELLAELADAETGGLLVQHHARPVQRRLGEALAAQGVILADLPAALAKHGALIEPYLMARGVRASEGKFAALHGALWNGGVFVYVPRGVQAALPLHAILWADEPGLATLAHTLIILEAGAQATVIQEIAGPAAGGHGLHVGATELFVGDGASLQYVSLQSWGRDVWNFSHERARVGRDARLDWIVGQTGSRLTKCFTTIDLDGEGSSGRMSGFFFADGRQHLDLDTQQNHNAPHTTSDLLYKGALKDRARSVWQGMIRVEPGAQRTDGYQANRNLLLSKRARADSIPGLEIMADDVRCTHGATVGQIDDEHVFYLMSRGLTRPDAERLIVDGFFVDIMDRIPFEGLRARLQATINAKLGEIGPAGATVAGAPAAPARLAAG
jgi:Fe-S cluster assembly protein SufD